MHLPGRGESIPHFNCGSQAAVSCTKSNLKSENTFSTESANLLVKGLSFWADSQFARSSFSASPLACPRGMIYPLQLEALYFLYEMAHGMPTAYPIVAGYICPHTLLPTQHGTNINSPTRDIFHMFGLWRKTAWKLSFPQIPCWEESLPPTDKHFLRCEGIDHGSPFMAASAQTSSWNP